MSAETPKRGRPSRQAQIVEATERLLRAGGLAGATTRAIAKAVPCSEGAIYVHFAGRLELILAVFAQALPEMIEPLAALEHKVGKGTPAGNLLQAAKGLGSFHERTVPMLGSLFAEPKMLEGFRGTLNTAQKGPHRGIGRIALYI